MVAGIEGVDDLAMTTNGALLANKASALREAGLHRLTVSLDSIDPDTFATTTDAPVPLATVLSGIEAASAAGFDPIKLNAVVTRGVNDEKLLDLVDFARAGGHHLRLIEYMDVGSANDWKLDQVVPAEEIIARITAEYALVPAPPATFGEVARRYRFADGRGELGVVTSVSQPFCSSCTRLRLTAIGQLYTCLFGTAGLDLRAPLRAGASDAQLTGIVTELWRHRTDRYSEVRSQLTHGLHRVEMFEVGG
jgi:cyclic pyranopterin phosphate synthase